MFQAFLRRFSPPAVHQEVPNGSGDCDLIIPVFNRPDEVRKLLRSLRENTNVALLHRIWIGDDGSDTFTSAALDRLAQESSLPITVIHHESNLGFGANCNDLFARSETSFCIILNTDIQLPPLWLERVLAPFDRDATVALATPLSTNAANHTIRLRSGQHWMEADRLLAGITPTFPDDCTAIAFCMAVNARVLREKKIPLFNPDFGRGYGEDTDLHYRVISHGLRSVIVDNLLVHHEGEASFGTLTDSAKFREYGESLFAHKWSDVHGRSLAAFQEKNALGLVREQDTFSLTLHRQPKHLDVLFVVPNANLRFGGIWSICEIAQALITAGFDVGVYITSTQGIISNTAKYGFSVFTSNEDLKNHVVSVACIVSTSVETLQHGQTLAQHFSATELLFLQSMEVVFRAGKNVETFLQYRRIKNVMSVSECLTEYIRMINPTVHVRRIRLGPDPLVFYPRDVARRTFTVALAANAIPEKGTTQALEIALLLRERGFHLTVFGWDTQQFLIDPAVGDILHDTSREALAHLFSHTEFIIDQSYLEGLGLLPLEAAFCGCIPLLGSRGGSEYIFQDGKNSITINGYKNLTKSLDRVQALTPDEKIRLSMNAMTLRSELNLEIGLSDAIKQFSDISGFQGRPDTSSLAAYALKST